MEVRLKSFTQFIDSTIVISENLKYHVSHGYSVTESVFRPGSEAHLQLLAEARTLHKLKKIGLSTLDSSLFESTDLGLTGLYRGQIVPLDMPLEELQLTESKYNNRTVTLNKPMRSSGGAKKYVVYVKNPTTGRIMKISFGDVHGGLTAKVSNPKARKSFAARHNCAEKKDKTKAGYWACRINRYAHLWGGKTYPGYW